MNGYEARQILNSSVEELKNPNKSVVMGVTDLYRAAKMLDSVEDIEWCEIRLGGNRKSRDLKQIVDTALSNIKNTSYDEVVSKIKSHGINFNMFVESGEASCILSKASGSANTVQYLSSVFEQMKKQKQGNDGTLYIHNLTEHIGLIRSVGIARATNLYTILDNADLETTFNILKRHVDDQLLDLDPELAEDFMLAFKNARSEDSETLSNSLLSGRRLIKKIADDLYPATDRLIDGHKLTDADYINRLAQYMQEQIRSKTDKAQAKATLQMIGETIYAVNKSTNKGVHGKQQREQAIKTLLLEYIVFSDLLDNYHPIVGQGERERNLPLLQTAKKEELQKALKISDALVKEIIKMRVEKDHLSIAELRTIKGIGERTIARITENFSLDS